MRICSSECGSYIEGEKLGVIPLGLDKGPSYIDPEWTEGRVPIDPEADRDARPGGIAEIEFPEAVADQGRAGGATRARRVGGRRSGRIVGAGRADVEQRRRGQAEEGAGVGEDRGAQAELLEARSERK